MVTLLLPFFLSVAPWTGAFSPNFIERNVEFQWGFGLFRSRTRRSLRAPPGPPLQRQLLSSLNTIQANQC